MGIRTIGAKAASAASTWGLKHLAHRPAANMPGKIALKIDPGIIAESMGKITEGSIVVVGTNGKTTVTNVVADALERAGKTVVCNRTGANLAYGVATALLQAKGTADWGVFESDELWLARTLPQVKATYVVLLNLFRDQLDRCGEIDHVQNTIAGALAQSPETTLIYNADDPMCARIAEIVDNPTVSFGVAEDLHQEQNSVADAQMCQRCSAMFTYEYRQYGQLGVYSCPNCGFSRPDLAFAAKDVVFGNDISFSVVEEAGGEETRLRTQRAGAYMVYNITAAWAVSRLAGVSGEVFQKAVDLFDPQNGRLQHISIEGRSLLLNLAKNPTGFNQNMKLITQSTGKKVVAFFVNDNEGDGHDISWLWDCDFEELSASEELVVFVGGIRKNDLQVRLKYAGIESQTIDSVNEMVDYGLSLPAEWEMYAIANYTALPAVRSALVARSKESSSSGEPAQGSRVAPAGRRWAAGALVSQEGIEGLERPLRIVHLYPDLLNLYGDGGNVRVLACRCMWRGIPVEVKEVRYGERADLSGADVVFLGGGPDREQRLASEGLFARCMWRGIPVEVKEVRYGERADLSGADVVFLGGGPDREQRLASEGLFALGDELRSYVEDGGPLLAICGGYQILGSRWILDGEVVEGLSVLDVETLRPVVEPERLIDDIALSSPLSPLPVIGYENHAGRTKLGDGVEPFGRVSSNSGHGNDDSSGCDGVHYLSPLPVIGYENHAGRTKLGDGVEPFGRVSSNSGHGNDDSSGCDGVHYRSCIGTYLHGPLLGKNPAVADYLIAAALERRFGSPVALAALDDSVEYAANAYMAKRLGVE